jgi:hypothetical protein
MQPGQLMSVRQYWRMSNVRKLRMIATLSGGGPNDRNWRDYPAGSELTVEDWEAEELIRIGLAVPVPDQGGEGNTPVAPEPVAEAPAETEPGAGASAGTQQLPGALPQPEDGTGVSALAQVSPLASAGGGTAAGAPEPEPVPEPGAGSGDSMPDRDTAVPAPPAPHENKQRWIDYAVRLGSDPDRAAAMTKAELMSKYGGRL